MPVGVFRIITVAILLASSGVAWPASTFAAGRLAATAGAPVVYQAEDAWMSGGHAVDAHGSGYAGTGYVTGFTRAQAQIVFAAGAPADGSYAVTLRYANGSAATKDLSVYTNGLKAGEALLPSTGSPARWSTTTEHLPLRTGVNTMAFVYERGSAAPVSLDWIAVAGGSVLAARGATLPYQEYEAEDAATNGTIIGPDRLFGDLAAEASGRKAVTLSRIGQYVAFTLRRPANGMVLRYSIPDARTGHGITALLGLSINGRPQQPLTLTSRYDYLYGDYPFTKNPAGLGGHHFYDEIRLLFASMLPAGSTVRLQVDRGDTAPSYTIDLADFEQVPVPYPMPAGYLDATAFGADPTGARDATAALQRAVNVAERRHQGLYIPQGTYTVTGHIILNDVTIRGAGPWYTILHGQGVGLYGDYPANENQQYPANADGRHAASAQVQVYDLMIQGETTDRKDNLQVNGFGGALGDGSMIQNVWIEHTKVGMWFDGPFSDLLVVGCRLRDLTADGLNLHDGISNVMVEQTQVRNSGDDGLALWSDSDPDSFDVFRNNTVQIPYLANNIAIYGGHQDSILHNYLTDTLTQGGGVNIGNRDYGSAVVPLSGTIRVSGNLLVRTGQVDPNWGYGVGALWFYAQTAAIDAHTIVTDDEIDDSTQEAIQFTGREMVENVRFDHITVHGTPTFVFQVQTDVLGVSMSHVVATRTGVAGVYNCGNLFGAKKGPGNAGWSGTACKDLQALAGSTTQGANG